MLAREPELGVLYSRTAAVAAAEEGTAEAGIVAEAGLRRPEADLVVEDTVVEVAGRTGPDPVVAGVDYILGTAAEEEEDTGLGRAVVVVVAVGDTAEEQDLDQKEGADVRIVQAVRTAGMHSVPVPEAGEGHCDPGGLGCSHMEAVQAQRMGGPGNSHGCQQAVDRMRS